MTSGAAITVAGDACGNSSNELLENQEWEQSGTYSKHSSGKKGSELLQQNFYGFLTKQAPLALHRLVSIRACARQLGMSSDNEQMTEWEGQGMQEAGLQILENIYFKIPEWLPRPLQWNLGLRPGIVHVHVTSCSLFTNYLKTKFKVCNQEHLTARIHLQSHRMWMQFIFPTCAKLSKQQWVFARELDRLGQSTANPKWIILIFI